MDFFLEATYLFNVFADGATSVRAVFFILYTLLLVFALWVFRNAPARFSLFVRFGAVIAAVFMFFVTLVLQLVVFSFHGIPFSEFAWFFDVAELTSSGLPHLHIGKGIVGATLGTAFPSLVAATDTARALGAALPAWSVVFMSFATLGAFTLALISYVYVSRRYEALPGVRHYAFFVLYALVSFIVLIKTVDGGLLSSTALLALTVYASLLLFPKRLLLSIGVGAVASFAVVFIFMATNITVAVDGHDTLIRIGALSVVTLALSVIFRYPRYWFPAALIALSIVISASAALNFNERMYRMSPVVPAGSWVTIVGAPPKELGFERLGGFGKLSVYRLPAYTGLPEDAKFRTVQDVLATLPVRAAYRPVAPFVGACEERTRRYPILFELLTPEALTRSEVSAGQFVESSFIERGRNRAGWYRYEVSISHHPCIASSATVLREVVREAGADGRGIVYRIRF